MTIREIEVLRKLALNKINGLKIPFFLSTLAIPIAVGFLLYKFGDIEFALPLAIVIFGMSAMKYIMIDFIDADQPMTIKREIMPFLPLLILMYFADDITKFIPNFGYVLLAIFTILAMIMSFLLLVKFAKIDEIKKYKDLFKNRYLKDYLAKFGYEYQEKGSLDQIILKHSKLFNPSEISNINDKICGKIDKVEFVFCDLIIKKELKDALYFGVFFYAEFNKNIKSKTFIKSKDSKIKTAENLKKIIMDDTKFNRTFEVYSTDAINAMYILSPALMKRILSLKWHLNFPISISFVGSKIYIFIDTGKDNFEPNIDISAIKSDRIIKTELSHFLSIVKTLNLNTRIWKV
ncbi:DUF3137 domain-containing protein [Campylobacter sp. VBCF_08 NA3]|uniref:DUF3137 domain-containing protein n=1 Tax=Campylobacter sp. VBCF_08 NA3 TaxID=2983833 RepID=UPI0022EA0D7A|nr:DUF3137 domain-containing protein [Campylobacter sp. VBCF_08 NA3]MDA3069925.1 DUF3137 domain-containing protein [Campylobacter sp. VBCF_08 NA3]